MQHPSLYSQSSTVVPWKDIGVEVNGEAEDVVQGSERRGPRDGLYMTTTVLASRDATKYIAGPPEEGGTEHLYSVVGYEPTNAAHVKDEVVKVYDAASNQVIDLPYRVPRPVVFEPLVRSIPGHSDSSRYLRGTSAGHVSGAKATAYLPTVQSTVNQTKWVPGHKIAVERLVRHHSTNNRLAVASLVELHQIDSEKSADQASSLPPPCSIPTMPKWTSVSRESESVLAAARAQGQYPSGSTRTSHTLPTGTTRSFYTDPSQHPATAVASQRTVSGTNASNSNPGVYISRLPQLDDDMLPGYPYGYIGGFIPQDRNLSDDHDWDD